MLQNAYLKTRELIETFKANEAHYLSPSYVEARVRQDFIDKLFTALGWDVLHDFQKNPFEQEVKVEKPQRQEGHQAQKRADYAFYLAPDFKKVQFFVEAKKPSRTLRQNRDDYFQTAKYGWNSQTGISILTDFEEIVMIDCRFKPDFDTILSNEIKYYKYLDLLDEDKFSEFYWLFSREAVDAGNLTKFVENLPQPKGKAKQLKLFGGRYQNIDDSFLDYIDDIRLQMAQAFYQNNPTLDHYDLTEATQRTIDRLVFIRFLEDKQIEPEDLMHGISTSDHPWRKFIELSKRLDAKYNGVVFKEHFIDKNAFLGANEELFKSIAQDLDHTNTPYDFNYIPIHILGNIYERFLGKIIVVEDGKARIELKPEVRKAGGVFYTPKYIVDYIVENTVGKKIADKKPKEIAKLKFADIACGSGSFLIGVYDYLLDYYKIYYNQNPDEAKKDGCKYDTENQIWVLSIKQKQQILLDNVFGVDIDLQATEVSQVSLFLKLLEDETMATANDMNVLFAEKILPDLSGNIKCGNSLIGYEIMDGVLEFGKEEMRKLNPFDFEQAFPAVFKNGGFDCIVGNPPYVDSRINSDDLKNYWKKHYISAQYGKTNMYEVFVEKGLKLLKSRGSLGFIIPIVLLSLDACKSLREEIICKYTISEISYGEFDVFDNANVDTMSIFFEKLFSKDSKIEIKKQNEGYLQVLESKKLLQSSINLNNGFKIQLSTGTILDKFAEQVDFFVKISDIADFYNGIATGPNKESYFSFEKINDQYKPLLVGNTIGYYKNNYDGLFINYDRKKLHRPREEKIFTAPEKILMQRIRNLKLERRLICSYDDEQFYTFNSVNNLLLRDDVPYSLKYLLGLLNSNLLNYILKQISVNTNITLSDLDSLPIKRIDFENKNDLLLHDALVKLVEQMLQAKKDEQKAVTDHDKNFYRNLIQSLDNRINKTVYELYNLTEEEIDLVEGA